MANWKEFELYIKFPDNDLMGKEGERRKVCVSVDISQVQYYYESAHGETNEMGVSLEFIGGGELFIIYEYQEFKKLVNAIV